MRVWAAGIVLAWSLLSPGLAQERVEEGLEITASGEAYLKSLRLRGVDADVVYFDPTRPAPELDTRQTPDPQRNNIDVSLNPQQGSFVANAIAVGVLLGVAFLFLRFGGRFSVSLRGEDDARRAEGAAPIGADGAAVYPDDLDVIARIEDRRLALATLAQSALIRAVTRHGLLLQKSWTARDALRRLPRDMHHRDALGDLVAAGERVLFGGRDVPEEDFQDHLTRIRPLFGEGAL